MDDIAIKANGEFLELDPNTKLRVRLRGPLFKRDFLPRSYTYPFKIPTTPNNQRILEHRSNLAAHKDLFSDTVELYILGQFFGTGVLNIRSYHKGKYDSDILIDIGALDELVNNLTLKDIDYGPAVVLGTTAEEVIQLANNYSELPSVDTKFTFFPLQNLNFYNDNNNKFGQVRAPYVTFYSQDYTYSNPSNTFGYFDNLDNLTISYRNIYTGRVWFLTITASPNPTPADCEISSIYDPNLYAPGTVFTGVPTWDPATYFEIIKEQLEECADFNALFDVEFVVGESGFSANQVDHMIISLKEGVDEFILLGGCNHSYSVAKPRQ